MMFRLVHQAARENAIEAIKQAPDGWVVRVTEPTRNLEQNALLHAEL
ncbi:MAG: recombination protein NinB, partial [Burkholderiales bacterium]|nr:recombination protein NinB [Burkholderiales bacterium]